MLMLVALMILIKAPFTLPALAGLALTVGMAVDNNVLIYERLREEIAHGAALRMAIRNAFHRVGVVIIDANITHLIAATVLCSVGTEQIKGFAVTFWLGAVLSIWATMFVARVIFEVAERRRWIQQLNMMQWIGHTKIDFMAWFPACATFSVIITVLGLVIAVVRGQGLFDIDFTGGVSVQTVFQEEQDIDEIRASLVPRNLRRFFPSYAKDREALPDTTVTNAHSQDEPDDQRFIIDTSNYEQRGSRRARSKKSLTRTKRNWSPLELTATPLRTGEAGDQDGGEEGRETAVPAAKTEDQARGKAAPPEAKPVDKPAEPSRQTTNLRNQAGGNKSAETKPAETKPAENKPKQSRFDLPALSLVAMAGREAVLLAQADSPAGERRLRSREVEAKPKRRPTPSRKRKPSRNREAKADAKPEAEDRRETAAKPTPKRKPKTEAKPKPKATRNRAKPSEAQGRSSNRDQGRFRSSRCDFAASRSRQR